MVHPRVTFQSIARTSSPGWYLAPRRVHALPLKTEWYGRRAFGHDAVRAQLDLPDFFENLAGIMAQSSARRPCGNQIGLKSSDGKATLLFVFLQMAERSSANHAWS